MIDARPRRSRMMAACTIFLFAVLGLGLASPPSALAGVVPAASPSLADVRAAIAAARSGDTVTVPAGSATWTGQLTISKGINLIGAGAGATIITSNYTQPNPGNTMDPANWLIVYSPTSPALNEPFRLSGFTLDLNLKCPSINLYNYTNVAVNKIRIDHNTIKNTPGSSIYAIGPVYGVIDHNTISGSGIIFEALGIQKNAWTYLTFELGTADNLYFEDNVVSTNNTTHGAAQGGRYCIRYNTYTSTNDLYPFCDAHGNQAMSNAYSTMGVEIYENVMNAGSKGIGVFDIRGGKGISFNNRINTTGSVTQKVRETDNDNLTPPANNVISGQPQHVSDSYFWGNRKNGTTPVATYVDGGVNYGGTIGVVPQANRDYWDESSNFNGTGGVGIGPRANRPATCTAGVAYWATDERILYKATAANTWSEYYHPYPYPHPLTNGIVPPTPTVPAVATTPVSGVTTGGAVTGGNVTSDGGSAVTARGICWGTSANPTVSGAHTSEGAGTGAFTSTLSGLSLGATYHVRAYAVNSTGTAYGANVAFRTHGPDKKRTDFNGDGLLDILWRNSVTGENLVWYLGSDGVAFAGLPALGLSMANTPAGPRPAARVDLAAGMDRLFTGSAAKLLWSPVEAGDGVSEKRSGILFEKGRPADTSWTASLGRTDSMSVAAVVNAWLPTVADTSWQIVGTADFSGDGLTDILWRNSRTGEDYVWVMNGMALSVGIYLPSVADVSWQIVGTADINGDDETDILWRNSRTGENYFWYMNGLTKSAGGYLPTVADSNWQIVGIGDLDKDGKADILWRNNATGENYVWYMNGAVRAGSGYLTTVTDLNWQIAGMGDANADGSADILWRNYATGENFVWYMNGTVRAGSGYLTRVTELSWQIVGR